MIDLLVNCDLQKLSRENSIVDFVCDNDDLTEFFCKDAINYQEELLGETYFFRSKDTGEIVCAYTLSNDSIRVSDLPGSRKKVVQREIPHEKSMKSYPAVLIGRLGVATKYQGQGIGTQLLRFLKAYVITEFGSKCRYIIVDSYNNDRAIGLYRKNEFVFVFSSEEQEMNYYEKQSLTTRFMFFDLKLWQDNMR